MSLSPTKPTLSRQTSSTSLNVGLPPPLPSSPSSRSLKRVRSRPRVRRGDVESSATSADEDEEGDVFATPRRKVVMPIEPMTVGRKRETLQERLANVEGLKKSRSLGMLVDKDKDRDKVVVCVRIKPTSSGFIDTAYELSPTSLSLAHRHPNVVKRGGKTGREAEYTYPVDMLLRQPSTTPELYAAKIAPLVDKAMNGFNSTIFAYGQTGSGKSFTMTGTSMELGVIPCAVDGVFDAITADLERAFLLRVSYVEIYNETLRDLLNFEKHKETPVIHSGKGKVYVAPLVEEVVSTPQDVMKLLSKGNEGRKVGATDWNERSSRSHCVFTIVIESRPRDENGDGDVRLSRLNLIDLAGSEKAVSDAERRGEGKYINQSLLALREVINKLTEKKRSHIPYRNSKLTHLLENALGGDSNICVICTMSAEEEHVAETLETLKFAGRCSQVETKAQKNILPSSEKALIRAKDAEIEELKRRLGGLRPDLQVEEMEERKKRLTAQLAKLNGEILTSEMPRLGTPPKPKRRRISEFLGSAKRTVVVDRRVVSGAPALDGYDGIDKLRAELAAKSTALLDVEHQLATTRHDLASNVESKQTRIDELEASVLDLRKSREDILIEDQNRLDEVQRKLDAAVIELQRAQRVATGDLPSDLEREQEAFRQDLAQMQRSHAVEVARMRGEMAKLRGELRDRWSVAEGAISQRKLVEAENARLLREVKHSREAVRLYDTAVARNGALEARVESVQAANNSLRVEMETAEVEAARAAELVDELRAERMDAMAKVAEMEVVVVSLREDGERGERDLVGVKAELERRTEELAARDVDYDKTTRLVERAEAERDEAVRRGDAARTELEEFQRKVMAEVELHKARERELEAAVQRETTLRDEVTAAGDALKAVEGAKLVLQAELDAVRAGAGIVGGERTELLARAEAAESAKVQMEEAQDKLRQEVSEAQQLAEVAQHALLAAEARASGARGEADTSATRIAELQRELGSARTALDAAAGTDAALTQLRDDLASAQRCSDEATSAREAVQRELDEVRKDMGESARSTEAVVLQLRSDVERAAAQAKEISAARDGLQGELDAAQGAVRTTEGVLAQLRAVAEQASAAQAALQRDLDTARKDLNSTRESVGASDGVVLQLRAEVGRAEERAKEAVDARAEALRELEETRSAASATALSVSQLRGEVERAEAARDALERELSAAREHASATETSISSLRAEVDRAEATAKDASAVRDGLQRELDAARDAAGATNSTVSQLRGELESAGAKAKEMTAARDGLLQELETAEKEVQALRQSGSATEAAVTKLQADIKALSDARAEASRADAEKVRAAQREVEALRVVELDLRAQLTTLTAAAGNGTTARAKLAEERDVAITSRDALQRTVSELERSLAALQGSHEKHQQLRNEVDELSRQIEARDVAVRDLTARLDAHKATGAELQSTKDKLAQVEADKKSVEGSVAQVKREAAKTEAALRSERDALLRRLEAASVAKETSKEAVRSRKRLPTIASGVLVDRDGDIEALEQVIEEQQRTIDDQREKILFWSNELEKQREVVRLLTEAPLAPGTIDALPTRGSIAGGKKSLTSTFTARNLALPSAPTPLPMHTGQYGNTTSRRARRTLEHDIESLGESSKVAQAKALWDSGRAIRRP